MVGSQEHFACREGADLSVRRAGIPGGKEASQQQEEGQERREEKITRRQDLPFGLIKILCNGPQESSSGASP